MNEPVNSEMRDFVALEIRNITAEHEKIVSNWNNVELNDENVKNLHNLFTKGSSLHVRLFEEYHFLGDEQKNITNLIGTRLSVKKSVEDDNSSENQEAKVEQQEEQTKTSKKSKKKKKTENSSLNVAETSSTKSNSKEEDHKKQEESVSDRVNDETQSSESDNLEKSPETEIPTKLTENDLPAKVEETTTSEPLIESNLKTEKKEKEGEEKADITDGGAETVTEEPKYDIPSFPANDDHLFVKPKLIIRNKQRKVATNAPSETAVSTISDKISRSNALKQNLEKLASDISIQQNSIKTKMSAGEPSEVNNEVLEDFISRANTVLKETEAVTVRKIAEAETKRFLTSANVAHGPFLETISNELMQDIWPKTNRWRSFCRNSTEKESPDAKLKKKMEDQIDKEVRVAIKSAGEPLNKKQIGFIRNAAIVYRDFDEIENRELEFRCDQTTKLVEYVSAYEAMNRLDELTLLRLAIAFCTKRRDYYLKARPKNFMQFSYMYIFLLEKVNSKTASICACLNNKASQKKEFDELEELLLNLFHEDYFLQGNAAN